jgi:8-oxo-dGTP pyrophosphatase MutT (NUDIX family)
MTELPPFAGHVRDVLASRERSTSVLHHGTPSAVLLPLFLDERNIPHVWLLKKTDELRRHGGQVALPGGKVEPSDRSLLETALREAEEEIGLPPARVDVLGGLDPYPTITGFLVHPFVGFLREPFEPVLDPIEVARVFSAPLHQFGSEGEPRSVRVLAWTGLVPAYDVEGETVWGATAAILRTFARLVLR